MHISLGELPWTDIFADISRKFMVDFILKNVKIFVVVCNLVCGFKRN